MTPLEIVKEQAHERIISAKLGLQQAEKDIESGNFSELIKFSDNMREIFKLSGFERQMYEAVQSRQESE